MPKLEVIKSKRDQILSIIREHGANNARIFGSTVRGEDDSSSDLDILIQLSPGRSLLDIIAIKQDLEDLLGCKVDVITEASLSPYLKDEILKTAVNL